SPNRRLEAIVPRSSGDGQPGPQSPRSSSMSRSHVHSSHDVRTNGLAGIDLALRITDPVVLGYLGRFEGADRIEKAQQALKVGVLSMQQATLSLDVQVVQEKFTAFVKELSEQFSAFLGEQDGV